MQCHKILEINPNFPPRSPEIGQFGDIISLTSDNSTKAVKMPF